MKAGVSHIFEDTVIEIDVGLKRCISAGAELLAAIPGSAAASQSLDEEALAVFDARRAMLRDLQRSAYGRLASHIARIGTAVDDERDIFDRREIPLSSDVLLGFLSRKLMRRRIERRAARTGGVERLRTLLGRADRLAGLIEAHRELVVGQRATIEDALSASAGRGMPGTNSSLQETEENAEKTASSGQDSEWMTGLVDPVARALNGAVRDLNLLLQKLGLDIEALLDLYSVLLSFDRERELHRLSPDAYPHFAKPVRRLADDLLPGARLDRSRRTTDLAFAKRFDDA